MATITNHTRRVWLRRTGASFTAALLLVAFVGAPTAAFAKPEYTSGRKAGRGMANTAFGVLALPGHMVKETEDRGAAIGLPLGFVLGLGWVVVTEVVGVYEFLTSPFELPPDFVPLIEPEFPWDYFEGLGDDPTAI